MRATKRHKHDDTQDDTAAVATNGWKPGLHFRLLESNHIQAACPRPIRPAIQHSGDIFVKIGVEWPDTITCTNCRCVIALPTPRVCPYCHESLPLYYVDRDLITTQQDHHSKLPPFTATF